MTASSNLNRNFAEMLTADNAALVMIDHQAGLMLFPGDIDPADLRLNAIALAKTAKLYNLPVVLSAAAQGPRGPLGPIIPEITDLFPNIDIIYRTKINSWFEPAIREAIEATGRQKLMMAGITADFCAGLPAKSAVADGYDVRLVIDASGNLNPMVLQTTIASLTQAGVVCTNWLSVAAELLGDWTNQEAQGLLEIYREHLPNWSMFNIIEQSRAERNNT